MEQKIEHMAVTIATHTEQIKTLFIQQGEQKQLTDSVHSLALAVRDIANEQKNTSHIVSLLSADVDVLKDKPAKRWDSVISVIITVAVTAILTYVLTQAGLK